MNLSRIFSVILTIFATSDALICYYCRYCDDIFQSPYVMEIDCTGMFERPACEKVVYELNNSSRGVIIRRCQFTVFLSNASIGGYHIGGNRQYPAEYIQQYFLQPFSSQNGSLPYLTRVSAFHCQSDYCNSSSITSGSLLIILIFILIFLFL